MQVKKIEKNYRIKPKNSATTRLEGDRDDGRILILGEDTEKDLA